MDIKRLPLRDVLLGVAGLLTFFVSWFLGNGGWFLLLLGGIWIIASEYVWQFSKNLLANPYLWMLLSPFLLWHYSSVADFRIRLACFFILIYILAFSQWRGNSRIKISLLGTKPWRIWLLSFMVFALAASAFYSRNIYLSGDEPHYLMIAQSLVEDGDFDLQNNLKNKTYLPYLPVELRFHGMVNQEKYRSFHLPGISFLLVPFFYLFNLSGGLIPANLYFRLAAAFINSFFALGLFKIMKTAWPEKDNSAIFLFFLITFPLIFQAIHLYPELPAATLLLFAYLGSRGQPRKFILPGLLLAAIPWLHLKYALPILVLILFVMAEIWRRSGSNKEKIRDLAHFLIPLTISALLLAFYSKMLYGSFNPAVISPEKNFFSIPLGLKIETLLSFFLDQRDGLLVYAPFILLLFLIFKKEIKARIRDLPLLSAVFLVYILSHAFTTVRGGYSPAARPIIFVFWIMALFVAAYVQNAGSGMGKTISRLLAGLTIFTTIWIFYYPLFLYQPVTRNVSQRASGLLAFMGSEAVDLGAFFPSFLKMDNSAYLPNWIWLGALSCALVIYYSAVKKNKISKTARFLYPMAGIALLAIVCFFPHVHLRTRYSASGLAFYCNSKNCYYNQEASAFRFLAGIDYDLYFDLKGSATDKLELRLLNNEKVTLKVKNGKSTLLEENQAPENLLQLDLSALLKFRLNKRNLVHLGLESKTGKGNTFFWLQFR